LNKGLLLLRRFADIVLTSKLGFSICRTASTCIMAVFDASAPVFRELPRQFGVKLGKREDGLL
jgi:hypothetical protein